MKSRIHYTKPSITDLEVGYATDAATRGWGESCYEYIERFEHEFARYIGVQFAIATSSCTGALHMGMAALGIGAGDEVILADSNWVATAAPIFHLGAKPVLVDILPDSWCLDPDLVEKAITRRTKAIVAVHLYGNLCDMDELLAIGARHGIPVIEDAAEAIGSVYRDSRAGSMGKFATFSFHGTKTMTTGEGGMFVTSDPELCENVLTLSNHGRDRKEVRQFWPEKIGFKYKMSNIQAAIGCAQLERIDVLTRRKRKIFHDYRDAFSDIQSLAMNPEPDGMINGAWMPTVVFSKDSGVTQEQLLAAFREANADARVFFWPLSSLPSFESRPNNIFASEIPARAINLPSYHDMSEGDIGRIVETLRNVCSKAGLIS